MTGVAIDLERAREEQQEQQDKTDYEWLKKAKEPAVVAWLAKEVPFGSKAEALSKIRRLQAAVKKAVPEAEVAIRLIDTLASALDSAYDGRPVTGMPGDLLEVTVETWEHILDWTRPNDSRRFLARFGEAMCRLERGDNGALGTMPLDQKRTVNLLTKVSRWGSIDPLMKLLAELIVEKIGVPKEELLAEMAELRPPPPNVATNILADPERPLPLLERVVEVPVLAPDGTVHERQGYDGASRCFYEPAVGLSVPRVPDVPAVNDVSRARELILDELLPDFPFVSEAETAHAICFLLEPFVRVMIDGCTPMYLFEAPTPGTGKTLLVQSLTAPTLGSRKLALMAEARDPDEWRKRLTAKLRTAPAYLIIDNVKRPLESGPLAMMLTAGVVEDRLLGVSEVVTLPVRCTIAATANNVQLSDEMTRRVVRIRMDSGLENPENRGGFRNELPAWAQEQRGDLVWAALTLARAWVVEGCPSGPQKPLGSFESWTKVMGGILHVADIPGLLANASELRAQSRDTEHGELLHAIYEEVGENEFTAAEVAGIARAILRLGDVGNDVAAQRLGYRLRQMVDRPMSGLVLRRGPTTHAGGRKWQIRPTGSYGSVLSGASGASGADSASGAGDAGDAGDKTRPYEEPPPSFGGDDPDAEIPF